MHGEARLPLVRVRTRCARAVHAPGVRRGAPSAEDAARLATTDPLQQREVSKRGRA